ncbi:MAG: nucleoside 2-deoxyribosyltransferase [Candidatus Thorarchaeota archaeon]
MLVYLSGPIIHKQLRKDDFYRGVIHELESRGIEVFAPQFLGPAEPDVIYSRDVEHVRKCDVLIAEVSSPSLGVGMEIMLAIELKTPAILFYKSDSPPLSKMVRGADGIALFTYENLADVVEILRHLDMEHLGIRKCSSCESHVSEISDNAMRCIVCGTE